MNGGHHGAGEADPGGLSIFPMDSYSTPDDVTRAACRWLMEGAGAGEYQGPRADEGHELSSLLSREHGSDGRALRSQALWLRMEETVRPVLDSIHSLGRSVWAFKGFDLARSLYPFQGARPMTDIDLFLRSCDISAVRDSFRVLGWTMGTPGMGIFRSGIVSEVKMQRLGTLVELHTHIFYFPATFPGRLPGDLFRCDRELAPGLRAFSWHNSLLMVVLHLLTNTRMRPVWWTDVCLLCGKVTESGSWKAFTRNALVTGLAGPMASFLRTASEEAFAGVPERVIGILEGHPSPGSAILDGLRRGRGMPSLMNLRYSRGWKRLSWAYSLLWLLISRRPPQRWVT